MRALYSEGFPVPQMIHYCDNVSIIGTEFYLMDYVPVSFGLFTYPLKALSRNAQITLLA